MENELLKPSCKVSVSTFGRDTIFSEIFRTWWLVHRGAYPSEIMVTDYGFCGFMDDKPVFISYLYPVMGSKSAMQGYQVCNPMSSMEERGPVIDAVTTKMCEFSKNLGYEVLVAYPGNRAILKRLKDSGFVVNDSKVVQVIKEL